MAPVESISQYFVGDLVYKVIVFNLLNKITYKMFFVTEAKYRLIFTK